MKALTATVLGLLVSMSSFAGADLLTLKPGTKEIKGVVLAESASTLNDNQAVELSLLGAGLRAKRVLIMVPVYVTQLFSEEPSRFERTADQALNSLDQVKTIALRMTFLRDVDAETVQSSYKEALIKNNVDTTETSVQAFLTAVVNGGAAEKDKSLTLLFEKHSDGTEVVRYENTKGAVVTISGGRGLHHKILSIWLGEPADGGLEQLKTDLLKGI